MNGQGRAALHHKGLHRSTVGLSDGHKLRTALAAQVAMHVIRDRSLRDAAWVSLGATQEATACISDVPKEALAGVSQVLQDFGDASSQDRELIHLRGAVNEQSLQRQRESHGGVDLYATSLPVLSAVCLPTVCRRACPCRRRKSSVRQPFDNTRERTPFFERASGRQPLKINC
jgi:hypothetical protein